MADQITKSIRNIVRGLRDDPTGLSSVDDNKSIGSSRGEAFINSRGDVSGSSSGSGGADSEGGLDDAPGSATPGTTDADSNDTGGTGGVQTDEVESGDAADVDDDLDSDTVVGAVTGTDPDSAKLTTVNFDSKEGIEYLPPDGWDTPDTPPDAEPGRSWIIAASANTYYESTSNAFAAYQASDPTAEGFSITGGSGVINIGWGVFVYNSDAIRLPQGSPVIMYRIDTPVGEENVEAVHPSTGSCQIAYDSSTGTYKGHAKDPDCSDAQKVGKNFVIIRSQSDPSKYFRYTKLADGGTKQTQVDSSGTPVPGSITKTFDESGRVTGWHDVSLDASIK